MRVAFKIAGVLLILMGLLLLLATPSGLLFIALGVIAFVYAGKHYPKGDTQSDDKAVEPAISSVKAVPPASPSAAPVEAPKPQPAPKKEQEVHKVAGVTYHKDEIMELAVENSDYDLTKREIIDAGMEDERIYQYDFPANKVELIDDPENEHDPNAIKVVIDGHHVGFIKKGSTGRIRNLRKAGRINKIDAEIAGGKYKVVSSYEDDDGREKFDLERDSHEIGIKLTLYLNSEE